MENKMNLQESIRNDLNKLNESNDFFKYVESFYGDGEIYARYFANDDGSEGASMEEITKAIDTLTNDDKWSWGGGDSMDREKVRDIMLANRETDHDDLNKISEEPKQKYRNSGTYDEKTSPTSWQNPADDLSGLSDNELDSEYYESGNGVDYIIQYELLPSIHKAIIGMKELNKRDPHNHTQRDIKDLITAYNTIRDLDWLNQEEKGHWFTKEK
jgi:hypothetical protein